MFKNGEESGKYEGPRNSDGIVAYMRKQAGPASTEIPSLTKWAKITQNTNTIIVGFFDSYTSGEGKIFMQVADALRDTHRFAHSTNEAVVEAAQQANGKVVLYRPRAMKNKFEAGDVVFDGEKFTVGILKTWIKNNALGGCPIATPDNLKELARPLAVAFYNVDYTLDPKGTQYWRNRIMKVGGEHANLHTAVGSATTFAGLINGELNGGAWDTSKPHVVIFDEADKKYIMEEDFTSDGKAFAAFITQYFAGEVEAFIKSDPLPENNGALKTVVGKNWDDLVMNSDADVFMKMYAPWCGHCKSMAPAWEEFAEDFADDDSIIIADFDATTNDPGHSAYSISGYPSLYWAKNGDKKNPQKYQGGRTIEDFRKWVKENRSSPAKDEL